MAKTTIVFYPGLARKNKKTGQTPLYLRVIHHRAKAEARLNAEADELLLLLWNPITQRFDQRDCHINKMLAALERNFELFEITNNYQIHGFSAREILDHMMGNTVPAIPKNYIREYVNKYLAEHVMPNQKLSLGTKKNYRKAINHLHNFLKEEAKENIVLEDFGHNLAAKFKLFLTSDHEKPKRKGMTDVSASSVITKIKVIFRHACDDDLIRKHPFRNIKIDTLSPPKPKLGASEIALIYQKDLSLFPGLGIYRDIFLFSVFTGLAYGDVIKLSRACVKQTEHGLKLTTYRGKTIKPVEQLLVSYAEEIFYKYQDDPHVKITGTILPYRSLTHLNIQVKVLAELCGISINLSSHIARHTCRQLLGEAEIEDMLLISRIMGWGSGNRINAIYYSITEKRLNDAKEKFELYLGRYMKRHLPDTNDNKAI